MGYSPWGRKESDMTEQLHSHFLSCILLRLQSIFAYDVSYNSNLKLTRYKVCHYT